MLKSKALASFVMAVLSWCLWPFAIALALATVVASLGLAILAFRPGSKRLVLASVGVNACGAVTFLCLIPAFQQFQEASRRTDIS